tara:strand:- start:42 stop:1076 length:1035 start_codon:yes stop_codon:yes gene_type:complete
MDYTKDLIRKILREQTEFGKYKPDFGRVDVSGDFSGKISNLISALGITGGLREKLEKLKNITRDENTIKDPQKQLSAIILLQYLKFIKINNNPQVAGFAFENYLAGLLDGEVVLNDMATDVYDANKEGYQVKFYISTNSSAITVKESHEDADDVKHFVLAIKDANGDNVTIYIIDRETFDNKSRLTITKEYLDENDGVSFSEDMVKTTKENLPEKVKLALNNNEVIEDDEGNRFKVKIKQNRGVTPSKLKAAAAKNNDVFELSLENINKDTNLLGEEIKRKINNLYKELDLLQNYIDAISVGVDKDGKPQDIIEMATEAKNKSGDVGKKAEAFKTEIVKQKNSF